MSLGQASGAALEEITQVISHTVDPVYLDEAPYRVVLVFGGSDLPWLRKFKRRYLIELDKIVAATTGDVQNQQELIADLQLHYKQVLVDVATRRASGDAGLQERLRDGVSLRDVRKEHDRVWLKAMIGLVEGALWSGPKMLPESMRELISASDLHYIRAMSAELYRVSITGAHPAATAEEKARGAAALCGQVRDYLESRAAR